MQSAFVNIGLERDAFLYVSDFLLEEEEDADGLEQVVSRSKPLVMGESPEAGTEALPLEAEEIVPSDELAAEESEPEEASHAVPEQHQEEEQSQEGARRWRGRRRRGRGRGRFGEREEREPSPQPPQEAETERRPEPVREERHERYERRPEPHADLAPMVLPGESISKYGGTPAASESRQAQPPTPARTTRASTEYTINPDQFSPGSMVLPGESLAKYQHESPSAVSAVAAEPHIVHEPERERGFEQELESPSRHEHSAAAYEQQSHEGAEAISWQEPAEPETHATEHDEDRNRREEERLKHMDVAAVFGNEQVIEKPSAEVEHQQTEHETSEPETFEAKQSVGDEPSPESTPETEPQPWRASPRGVMEEEEIEEEESELPGYEEDLDLAEFDELEEEVLGPGDERLVPMGGELTEAVRDAHINERASGRYEDEGLEERTDEGADETPEDEFLERFNRMAGEQDEEQGVTEQFDESEEDDAGEPNEGEEEPEGARAEHRVTTGTAGYQQPQRGRRQSDRRGGRRQGRHMRGRRFQAPRQLPAISDLLKEGQEILVQIAKEPIAKKGARITSHIALPGRYLVYMPTVHHTGVSRKIASEEERHRLKRIVISERGDAHGGFIVRTAAAGANEEDLRADIRFLINLWNEIRGRAEKSKAPALIYHDLNLVERILRDQVTSGFSAIWADTEQEYERVLRFVSRFQSSLVKRVKLYSKETPLFEQFNITEEINKALKSKVWLKSGGYIVINQTEALVAIDINTGKYVGKTARLEDTIVKTNIDAIKEIVRQIRLRDLGGIIVIDFIDMDERKNRQKVMQALEEALKADRAPSKVLQFNDFGLVAITRKRVKQSLERTLGQPCPTCQATGMIKSVTTVCNEIYVELRKMTRHFERDVMLRVNPEVAKALKANSGRWLQEMEDLTKKTILVKSDALLHPEHFDIQ